MNLKRGDKVLAWELEKTRGDEMIYVCTIEGAAFPHICANEPPYPSRGFRTYNYLNVEPLRPELKVDDRVLVRDSGEKNWHKAHFAMWDGDGAMTTWEYGKTSWTSMAGTLTWDHWKLPEGE